MNIRELLKQKLSNARPARYTMDDREWIDDVADRINLDEVEVSIDDALRDYVRNQARDVEGKATKAGNKLMREFYKNAALPFGWLSMVNEPIALENKQIVDGRIKTVKERVRLRDATSRDFELWAETEDAARNLEFRARGEAVEGARSIAREMQRAGVTTFGEWAENYAPVEAAA